MCDHDSHIDQDSQENWYDSIVSADCNMRQWNVLNKLFQNQFKTLQIKSHQTDY